MCNLWYDSLMDKKNCAVLSQSCCPTIQFIFHEVGLAWVITWPKTWFITYISNIIGLHSPPGWIYRLYPTFYIPLKIQHLRHNIGIYCPWDPKIIEVLKIDCSQCSVTWKEQYQFSVIIRRICVISFWFCWIFSFFYTTQNTTTQCILIFENHAMLGIQIHEKFVAIHVSYGFASLRIGTDDPGLSVHFMYTWQF